MAYKLKIGIGDSNKNETIVAKGSLRRLPEKIIRLLFGDFGTVLVLSPTEQISIVEIHEASTEAK